MTAIVLPSWSRWRPERKSCTPHTEQFTCLVPSNSCSSQASHSPSSKSHLPPGHSRPTNLTTTTFLSESPLTIVPPESPSLLHCRSPSAICGKSTLKFTPRRRHKVFIRPSENMSTRRSSSSSPSSESRPSSPEAPLLSPTTTISPSPSTESRKKRPDPTYKSPQGDCKEDLGFPFGKPVPASSTPGRDLGSVSEDVPPAFRAHPGIPVTFSSASVPPNHADEKPLAPKSSRSTSSTTAPAMKESAVEEYHRYLHSTTTNTANSTTLATTQQRPNSTRATQSENLDCRGRKLVPLSQSTQRCERTVREGTSTTSSTQQKLPPLHTNTAPSSTPASPTSLTSPTLPMSRSSIDSTHTTSSISSTSSAEIALRHIRASFEARKSREEQQRGSVSYDVFKDEMERGFIGDEPL